MENKARILVIDDDKSIRETLVMILEMEGYLVDRAENGEEAIAKSYAHYYNVAIVDWRLPDIEGTDLLGKLKESTPKMVKIMLTGCPSMDAIAGVNKRADAFLLKPVDFEVLLGKIQEFLKLQGQAKEFSEDMTVNFIETRVKQITQEEDIKQSP